jgi:hypothetical protein
LADLAPCQECGRDLRSDLANLRFKLTCDDEPINYCLECWEREFGDE